jgi:hypothetical protein
MRSAQFSRLTHRESSGIDARSAFRPPTDFSAAALRNPMRRASHIAAAPRAATGRFDRPSDRLLVGALGYSGCPGSKTWSEQGSRLKPE